MATKRKQAKESNTAAAPATDASPEKRASHRDAQPTRRKRRWPLITVGALLAVVLLAVGIFSWDRWLRYDDAAEFQGEWQTRGTTAIVVIDGETIKLAEDVAYAYTLDTGAKTITFKFGNMEGAGRYRFSLDRSQLVITDGDGYSWLSTLTDDIAWQYDQIVRAIQGQPQVEPPSNDEATVLDRLSHDASATPQIGAPVEPAPAPEPGAAPDPEPTSPETAPESADGNAVTDAEDAAKDASEDVAKDDAGTSSAPRDVFDVSDLPA